MTTLQFIKCTELHRNKVQQSKSMFQYVKKTGAYIYIYILCSSASLVGKLDNMINKYCGTWKVGTPTKVRNNNNSAMTNILTDAVVYIMGQLRFIKDKHMWYL